MKSSSRLILLLRDLRFVWVRLESEESRSSATMSCCLSLLLRRTFRLMLRLMLMLLFLLWGVVFTDLIDWVLFSWIKAVCAKPASLSLWTCFGTGDLSESTELSRKDFVGDSLILFFSWLLALGELISEMLPNLFELLSMPLENLSSGESARSL